MTYQKQVIRCWIKNGFRIATEWRQVKKGKDKNKYEVIRRGRKHIVNKIIFI